MEELSSKSQMEKIRNFENGFMATHLINLGNRLGIFEAINECKEGITVPDLAKKLGLHEPYLKIWCLTAYHFQILDGDDQGRFILQPYLDEILGDKSHNKNYLVNIALDVELRANAIKKAPDLFLTGNTIEEDYNSPEISKLIYKVTENIPSVFHFMIFPKKERLKEMLEQGIKFLDIGCGNGSLIIQMAQTFKNSIFFGINPDNNGIEDARKAISHLRLEERVSVENIGGEDLQCQDEFDMISMIFTLHEILPDIRQRVMEKAYQALKSGGCLLILDFPPYPTKLEDFRNPIYESAILDQFFEINWGYWHLNLQEQDDLLTKVGFKDSQRTSIGKGMFEFIAVTK
jgi:ubiquinone/menaquinone biosynthesis C-methylase UbiE